MATEEERRPADGRAAIEQAGDLALSVDRARGHRRPSDRLTTIDYEAMGFTLGYTERAVIGSALLALERAE
ncbi:hypothetical protein SAMN05421541_110340 [Actinoplanes philippinensis]|uniref:Uncharacterized protein n=2 Tax=Actinoplanes philippinensis TaxID=35752 RepID=A0A1I2IPW3_9ACTN|nr:hypothetical protein SAMN05421541_110340 [Actinoplanes philippinensis]